MKRILFPFCIFFLLSCSKDEEKGPEFYFRFTANGVQKEYLLTGSFFYSERNCLLGASLDSINNNRIAIELHSIVNIKADTTYIETQAIPAPPAPIPYTRYYIRLADNYPAYNYSSWVSPPAGGASIYPCTVTILEIDANHLKGRFSGKVSNDAETAFITITNGEFNVKR
jgi:hypothetical protein